jgi:tRNA(fMet)-specific endonuclease VapC
MADQIILVDTSILIDYYRRTDKEKSAWIALVRQEYSFAISAITKFEIFSGATPNQLTFWGNVLRQLPLFLLTKYQLILLLLLIVL